LTGMSGRQIDRTIGDRLGLRQLDNGWLLGSERLLGDRLRMSRLGGHRGRDAIGPPRHDRECGGVGIGSFRRDLKGSGRRRCRRGGRNNGPSRAVCRLNARGRGRLSGHWNRGLPRADSNVRLNGHVVIRSGNCLWRRRLRARHRTCVVGAVVVREVVIAGRRRGHGPIERLRRGLDVQLGVVGLVGGMLHGMACRHAVMCFGGGCAVRFIRGILRGLVFCNPVFCRRLLVRGDRVSRTLSRVRRRRVDVMEMAGHAHRSGVVVLSIVRLAAGQSHPAVRVGDDLGGPAVFVTRPDNHLCCKQPGADQHTERQRSDDRDPRSVCAGSTSEPTERQRIRRPNGAVRRRRDGRRNHLGRRRMRHGCRIRLSRRWMGLKFSLLRGPKTSVNAIFHPQPPFSISRRTKSRAANNPREFFRIGFAAEGAQAGNPIPWVLSARSRAPMHKWLSRTLRPARIPPRCLPCLSNLLSLGFADGRRLSGPSDQTGAQIEADRIGLIAAEGAVA
jgi:hypothetical protein